MSEVLEIPIGTRVKKIEGTITDLRAVQQSQNESLVEMANSLQKLAQQISSLSGQTNLIDRGLSQADGVLKDIQIRAMALARVAVGNSDEAAARLDNELNLVKTEVMEQEVANLIEGQMLEPADSVQEDSMVVFTEYKDDGTPTIMRAQYSFAKLKTSLSEDIAKLFLSKQVGESFKTSTDSDRNLKITEIYRILR